jgi:hypothetical protein
MAIPALDKRYLPAYERRYAIGGFRARFAMAKVWRMPLESGSV